ncbi:helix-turn-helix transcriptional regulator [Ruegeria atlantica]|uniref:helix-turn-helix transcriptional regulator n=1 Tax=Ruegeria atlantica TaxID=81569 RepID=UPI002494A712|nr:helix-turn-helix transcriptional regulator [Ruegeria atlantica]
MIDRLDAKIRRIYDAAYSAHGWNGALDAVLDGTQAHSTLLYDGGERGPVGYSNQAANTRFAQQPYVAEYRKLISGDHHSNYDLEAAQIVHSSRSFRAILDQDCFDLNDAFNRRPEIEFTINRIGVYRRFFVNLSEDPLSYSGLIVMYPTNHASNPPQQDIQSVELLSPHLAKALEMHRAMHELRMKYKAVLSVLDMIDVPICILQEKGHVILKNRRATDLFSERDGVWVGPTGHLVCRSDDVSSALRLAVEQVCSTASGKNLETSRSMELPSSRGSPLYAIASPLRDSDYELEPGLSGCLLTLIDGNRYETLDLNLIGDAYRLTIAERRIAALMASAFTNPEISERLNIRPETVKSHVSSVLAKTQCKNRLAFVWRVFQFQPPVL